ncbi:MAG: pyruvate kinase [Gammaproteobacteria bacterium]|nr:pyruvate kinase [Gammaproteobacteria bacterium]
MQRRTKIIATLGPSTDRKKVLEDVIKAGLDCARVNFSHGSFDDHRKRILDVRAKAEKAGKPIGLLCDLQGPKIRIEGFKNKSIQLRNGMMFTLDPRLGSNDGDDEIVGVTYKNLPNDVSKGDDLLLDDGNIVLRVEKVDATIRTRVITGGELSGNKGVNRRGGGLSTAALTEKDYEDIRFAAEMDIDYLAVSFARDAQDIETARRLLREAGGEGHIMAKIERAEALENMKEIIEASDVVMIARGDLGVEVGNAELPGVQKRVIREARLRNTIVVTATQMMQSMVDSPQPTRAEVLDVANAILDGSDVVMLSAETAVGKHPARVVAAMDRICEGAERHMESVAPTGPKDRIFNTAEEAVAMATMYAANRLDVAAIVTLTESGMSAKWISRLDSTTPIFAITSSPRTQRRVTLYRGVYPIDYTIDASDYAAVDHEVVDELIRRGIVNKGDRIIITKGERAGVAGGTNTMKIVRAGDHVAEQ